MVYVAMLRIFMKLNEPDRWDT